MKKTSFLLAALVFFLDRITKLWIESHTELLNGYQGYPVIEGFFKIQHISNRGIAFGLLHSVDGIWKPVLLSIIAVIALIVLAVYVFRTPERQRLAFVAYGLLMGGILGNFFDRIIKGEVTDFITLHWKDFYSWPTFNIADAAITTGVFLLLLSTFLVNKNSTVNAAGLLFCACFAMQPGITGDAELLLSRVEESYRDVQSFSADFVQAFSSRGISSVEKGRVLMKRPGLMRWEYTSPEKKLFIADGEKTYFYLEEEKQLLVSEFNIEETGSPLLFFLGKQDIRSRFSADMVNQESGLFVRLKPLQPDPEIEELIIEVDNAEYLIKRIIVRDPVGQQNEYILTNMDRNVHIANQQFRMKVPSDVEIIEQ